MSTKTVFQFDAAGMFSGQATADESPLEPGVWHMPARTTEVAPPEDIPDGKWPRWSGADWRLVNKPRPLASDPVRKLADFLAAHPDVAALIAAGKEIPQEE